MNTPRERLFCSLDGLSVGDAFGQRFFGTERPALIPSRTLPPGPWRWTDDTEMALSVCDELLAGGRIVPDSLAARFANRFDPSRGYGAGAFGLLRELALGVPWEVAARSLFGGQGSYGNGAAMRAAPIGAYFAGDLARAAEEARWSAIVTHAHPEGQAGAIAVAVAASLVAGGEAPRGNDFLDAVAAHTPEGETRSLLLRGKSLRPHHVEGVASVLGTGYQVSSQDTVPFSLFAVAHFLDSYEDALWWTVAGLGDRDTTCAIVGGVVALQSPPPAAWLAAREPIFLQEAPKV